MPLNLVQHRGRSNIWERRGGGWDPERWVATAVAGVCLVSGFRHRSTFGWMLVIAGGSLAWWAAAGRDERQSRRARLRLVWPLRHAPIDPVDEASEESFPASDAPSWSGTIGNGGADEASAWQRKNGRRPDQMKRPE